MEDNLSREEQEAILNKYKKEVKDKKEKLAQAKGQLTVIREQIKEEFGIEPTIDGVKKEILRRKKELDSAYDKLNMKIKELQREYPIN